MTDASARAMVLTGDGDVFCAGADLKERRAHPGKDSEFREPLLKLWHELAALPKPVVMAVNGHGIGGGFELALLGDAVVIARPEAYGATFADLAAAYRDLCDRARTALP